MDIQDLGAMGEFVSSVVIVVTLIVLIYEVRNTRRATLEASAQQRRRGRNEAYDHVITAPHIARIWEKVDSHVGTSAYAEVAREFGVEPDEWRQLDVYFMRMVAGWREAFESDLPRREREILDNAVRDQFARSAGLREFTVRFSRRVRPGAPAAAEPFLRYLGQRLTEASPQG